jgi:hypothetical protein
MHRGGPALGHGDDQDQRDGPEAKDDFDFSQEMENMGLETDFINRAGLVLRPLASPFTLEAFLMLLTYFVGTMHDFRRQKCVHDGEEKQRCGDAIEGFLPNSLKQLVKDVGSGDSGV